MFPSRLNPAKLRGYRPSMAKKRPKLPQHKAGKPPTQRARVRLDPLVVGLLALAIAIRLCGLGDRLPDPTLGINVLDDSAVEETDRTTMGRAWTMWGGGTKAIDLNPHTGGWPGFSFYFGLVVQLGYKAYYSLSHPGATSAEFSTHISQGSNHMFLFGRLLSVLIGALTVFFAFRLAARLGGRAAGLIAGLLIAFNPLHIMTSQHIADPNLLALLFVLLAVLALGRVAEKRALRDSIIAGAMIGLAGASKYVPLVLVVPLAVAHGRDFLKSRSFYLALLAVGVAMFVGSPFTFLDWKTTLLDMTTQRRSLFSDWVGQTSFPFSLPTYLAVSLPHAMGWPAYLLALVGMWLLWRRLPAARPVLLIPIVMVLANGALKAAQERYMLVAMPVLAFGTASAILYAAEWLKKRGGIPAHAVTAAPILVGALALAWPLPEYLAYRREISKPDTRHLARAWINKNIPTDRPMAVELYGPIFQPPERTMLIWPFFATQVPLVRIAYHAEFLDGLDYYVLSREVARRFDADSTGYPVESAYYRWIRANAPIVWQTDARTSSGPQIEVRRVPPGISTQAERDSLFAALMPTPSTVHRVALWCLDNATVFGRLSRYDRAIEWAMRGLKVNAPRLNGSLHKVLAFAYLNLGQFPFAEASAAAGITYSPRDQNLRLYRAMALQESGRLEEALEEFVAAYGVAGDQRVLLNVAAVLTAMGRYEEAVRTLGQVPPNHPDRGTARQDMAVILLNQLDQVPEGIAALREAASLARDPQQARLLKDEIARIEGKMKKAGGAAGATPQQRER